MQENETELVEETTCFNEHKKRKIHCCKKSCRQWMDSKENFNCAILGAEKGEFTLQQIGDIFGVTRMRVCQMEKLIIKSLTFRKTVKKSR